MGENRKPFRCNNCNKRFINRNYFDKHTSECKSKFKCSNCNKNFTSRHFYKHQCKKQEMLKKTNQCKSKMEEDRKVYNYKCSNCNKSYISEHFYKHPCKKQEMLVKPEGKRSFTCNICRRAFQLRIALKRHITFHLHDGQKSMCDKCDKIFPGDCVTDHVCVPSNEIVFPCDECNSFFNSDVNLRSHKLKSHVTKKNIVCMHCKKVFYSNYHLERHQGQETCLYAAS